MPFTFPPPPPPPPPAASTSQTTAQSYHPVQRGRGRGSFRARGRGSFGGHAQPVRGNFGPGAAFGSSNFSHASRGNARPVTERRPKPDASPAVPAFGAPLLPAPPTSDTRDDGGERRQKRRRTHNQLGLTPNFAKADGLSSGEEEDDANEEARLASKSGSAAAVATAPLQFEYNGQVATLRTPAEIASWIAERRKRWPTADKVEAHRAEQQKKKAAREQAWREKSEARAKAQEARRGQSDRGRDRGRGRGRERGGGTNGGRGGGNNGSRGGDNNGARGGGSSNNSVRGREKDQGNELARAEAALEEMRAKVLKLRRAATTSTSTADALKHDDKANQIPKGAGHDSSELSDSSSDVSSLESPDASSDVLEGDSDHEELEDIQTGVVMETKHEKEPNDSKVEEDEPQAEENADDNDDDAPPEEVRRGEAPTRMPASARNSTAKPSTAPQQKRQVCSMWVTLGWCPLHRLHAVTCRDSHPPRLRGSQGSRARGVSLRQRLEEREREQEEARIVAAIRSLGEAGLLDDEADAQASSAEAQVTNS